MNYGLRRLLCFTLITCITACASSPGYKVAKSSPAETYAILSRHVVIGEHVRVHLLDGTVITMAATAVTPQTLNGWLAGSGGFRKIPLKDIAKVEADVDSQWRNPVVWAVVAGVVLIVAALVLAKSASDDMGIWVVY